MQRQTADSGSATTTEIDFSDAPSPPTYRLTLRMPDNRSLWERIKAAAKSLSPENLMKLISNERDKIKCKLEKGVELTDEDIELLNKSAEEQLNAAFKAFKEQYMETVKIDKEDPPETKKLKIDVQDGLVAWLGDLFAWVFRKIREIFVWIGKAIDWCFDKVKELFEKLYSFFSE